MKIELDNKQKKMISDALNYYEEHHYESFGRAWQNRINELMERFA